MQQLSDETRAEVARAIVELKVFARVYAATHPEAVSPVLAAGAGKVLAAYAASFELLAPVLGISHQELDAILEAKREDWLATYGPNREEE